MCVCLSVCVYIYRDKRKRETCSTKTDASSRDPTPSVITPVECASHVCVRVSCVYV